MGHNLKLMGQLSQKLRDSLEMICTWGHILKELTSGALEMEILSEGFPAFPLAEPPPPAWIRTVERETFALTQQLGSERSPTLLLALHTVLLGVVFSSPGWLPAWKEIVPPWPPILTGQQIQRHPPPTL